MEDPTSSVRALARPVADHHGLALLDVSVKGAGSRTRVRLTVDRKGGVDLETCQQVSRELSRLLDDADPIPDRFVLEVTSPGVDWPLADAEAFDRVQGRVVEVLRRDGSSLRGEVVGAGPEAVTVRTGDGDVAVAYGDVERATQAVAW